MHIQGWRQRGCSKHQRSPTHITILCFPLQPGSHSEPFLRTTWWSPNTVHRLPLWCLWVFVVVHLLSWVWLSMTPWTAAYQASLSVTVFQSLLKFMSMYCLCPWHVHVMVLSNHLILCRPFLLCPSVFPASRSFPLSWLFSGCQSI